MPTLSAADFSIEPLASDHDRTAFDCGVDALNRYLHTQARQEMERGVTVAYVLVFPTSPRVVEGYYTLSAKSVPLSHLPEKVAKKLPRYPNIPATLLGRLAVSARRQGLRLGEKLLLDVMYRALVGHRAIGSTALFVDAKDEPAARFYERYDFKRPPEHPLRLFLPMKSIAALFG